MSLNYYFKQQNYWILSDKYEQNQSSLSSVSYSRGNLSPTIFLADVGHAAWRFTYSDILLLTRGCA